MAGGQAGGSDQEGLWQQGGGSRRALQSQPQVAFSKAGRGQVDALKWPCPPAARRSRVARMFDGRRAVVLGVGSQRGGAEGRAEMGELGPAAPLGPTSASSPARPLLLPPAVVLMLAGMQSGEGWICKVSFEVALLSWERGMRGRGLGWAPGRQPEHRRRAREPAAAASRVLLLRLCYSHDTSPVCRASPAGVRHQRRQLGMWGHLRSGPARSRAGATGPASPRRLLPCSSSPRPRERRSAAHIRPRRKRNARDGRACEPSSRSGARLVSEEAAEGGHEERGTESQRREGERTTAKWGGKAAHK